MYSVPIDNKGRVIGNGIHVPPKDTTQVMFIRHLTKQETHQSIRGGCPMECRSILQYWVGTHGINKFYLQQYCPLHQCGHAESLDNATADEVVNLV